MTDEILQELWDAKDDIAKEYDYNIDELVKHYLQKQASKHGVLRQKENKQAERKGQVV